MVFQSKCLFHQDFSVIFLFGWWNQKSRLHVSSKMLICTPSSSSTHFHEVNHTLPSLGFPLFSVRGAAACQHSKTSTLHVFERSESRRSSGETCDGSPGERSEILYRASAVCNTWWRPAEKTARGREGWREESAGGKKRRLGRIRREGECLIISL